MKNWCDITTIYNCRHCNEQVAITDPMSRKSWRKKCPICKKQTLVVDHSVIGLCTLIDTENPKTLGMLGQKNQARKDKENPDPPKKNPFWRKNKDKPDLGILKNVNKYIYTGKK